MKKIFFLCFLLFAKNVFAMSPLDVTTTVSYLSSNRVFHKDNLLVNGFVKFNAGATILSDASAVFNIQFPFSGGLDLRETGTLILQGDLQLDSNFTLSRSGSISGNGKTIFLNEDLRIPDNSIIHIKSDTIINGQGNDLIFGRRGRIFVDTNITLTLRNMRIVQTFNDYSDPCIRLATHKSNLALENIELALSQDFLFPQGQLFIDGDVAVTGTSAFIYQSTQHTFIAPESIFYFDIGTTFSAVPATFTDCAFDQWPTYTSNSFVVMASKSSRMYFNECSLFTTPTGCRFATGTVNFDNRCLIKSNSALEFAQTDLADTFLSTQTGILPSCIDYSRDGNYVAVVNQGSNTLQIFDPSTLAQIGSDVITGNSPISVSWSITSTQLAVINAGDNTVKVYNFSGGTPTLSVSASTGSNPSCVAWSLYGKYIAVTNSGSNTLQIFKSDTLAQIGSNASTGNQPSSVSWAPGDKLLAITNSGSNNLQIFQFNYTSTPVQIAHQPTEFSPSSVSWAQNGIFLSVVNKVSNSLQIFSFDSTYSLKLTDTLSTEYAPISTDWTQNGDSLAWVNYISDSLQYLPFYNQSVPTQIGSNANTGNQPNTVAWSPVANYIAVGDWNGLSTFSFNGSSTPAQTGSTGYLGYSLESISWEPAGNYIAIVGNYSPGTLAVYGFVAPGGLSLAASTNIGVRPKSVSWSPVGNYIAVVDSSTNQLYVYNFTPPATLTLVGSVGGGNTPYAVAWDPSGTFLAVAEYNAPNHLRIYSFSGGAPVFVGSHIIGTGSWGQSVCWDPTGQFIAVAANFRNILQIFSFNGSGNPQPLVNIQPSTSSSSTAWSSDGRFIITTDNFNNSTQIFSFNGINSLNKVGGDVYNGANSNPFSSVWSFDSKFMAVVNNGTDKLQVFSLQQAHSISPIIEKVTTKSAPSSVSCSPNNTDIAVAASNVNELQIFQFQSPTLLTLVGEIATGNDPYSLSWSPDRRFVVVPNYYANTIKIFSFNGSSAPQLVASATGGGKPVWAPCGNFIFSGGQVFLFDGTSSITTVGNNIGGGNGYSWSPNGRFIAIVSGTWGGTMRIFSFNGQSTPTQVASIAVGNQPTKAEWSPDGRFIAVCNAYSDTIQVFSFDGVGTITQIGSNISTGTYPNSASWSPDGRFIAVCNAGANTLQIFSFNGVGTPKKVGQDAFPASGPLDTLWSSNGKFIMIPCHNPNQGTVSEIQIFSFDGFSTPILIKATLPSGPTLNLNDSAWSPDGKFVGITVGD